VFVIQIGSRSAQVRKNGDKTVTVQEPPTTITIGGDSRIIDDEIVAEFVSRQHDLLEYLENLVLDIEINQTEADLPDLMRFFHTLKGESALLGLDEVSRLAHATEDMLQREPLIECVDHILDVKDWLALEFAFMTDEGEEPGPVSDVIDLLTSSRRTSAPPPSDYDPDTSYDLNRLGLDADMLHDFIAETGEHLETAEAHLLTLAGNPEDTEAINAVFRCFHTIKGVAGFVEMDYIKELAHKAENLLDQTRRSELRLPSDHLDLAFASVDMLKRLSEDVVAGMDGDGRLPHRAALPVLIERLCAACDEDDVAAGAPAAGETVVSAERTPTAAEDDATGAGLIILPKARQAAAPDGGSTATDETAAADRSAPAADGNRPKEHQRSGSVHRREAVRVDAERLDLLVETIGELVIAEAMISQNREIRGIESVTLAHHLDRLDKICRELQQIGMSLSMVPVRPIFQKMARLVRDLAKKSGRRIELTTSGKDTELDKSVVDKIGDPLVHMLRNAMDHGIESDPDKRLAAGKTPAGNIELRAFHRGGCIVIEVEDDGRGLDRDAILAKAVERGVVGEGVQLTDQEIFNLIFEPGFTTASEVTDLSGRGVGMDVVRRNIDKLRGAVDITSEQGRGSVFSLRLPLTLAIIEGMVFLTGDERYIIPTLSVVRLIRPTMDDYITVMEKGELLRFEGEVIPLVRLCEVFGVADAKQSLDDAVVIVVESEGRRVGLLADELIGQQQVVIKSLGEQIQGTEGLAGGTIMSDGNVALILDIAGLVKVTHDEKDAVNMQTGGRS